MRAVSAGLVLLLAIFTPTLADERPVRISVLSLLGPEAVRVTCGTEAILVTAEARFRPISIKTGDALEVRLDEGSVVLRLVQENGATAEAVSSEYLRLSAAGSELRTMVEVTEPAKFQRSFAGNIEIRPRDGVLLLILEAPLERIVAEVTAAEMPEDSPDEAKAALAVVVRSYVKAMRGRHAGEGFDLCDTTHCVLYRGLDGAFGPAGQGGLEAGRRAAERTAGMVLSDGRNVVPGYFHACCGGQTTIPDLLWPGAPLADRFEAVRCDFCRDSRNFSWVRSAKAADVLAALELPADNGPWQISTENYDGSPFVRKAHLTNGEGNHDFDGDRFRILVGRSLGWNVVRSNAFTITRRGDEFVFEGKGFGHGVGLCQDGAAAAAAQGWDWRRILKFYFPRCVVRQSPSQ